MVELSSNRQRVEKDSGSANNMDRISSLPDSLLCHILSFLPTKTCVQTSLLSHRWRHIWQDMQVLDFYDDFYNEFESFECFSVFVNGVLALRRSRDIRKMKLSCGCYSHEDMFYTNSVTTWVRTAIGPKLEEFSLTLCCGEGLAFVMPSTLFTCTNLTSLSLCGGIAVNVQKKSKICFPSLKTLRVDINYVDSLDSLLSGCPNLESLDTSFTTDSEARIHMPHSLKSLVFCMVNDFGSYLGIDAPNLKKLKIIQRISCGSFIVNNLPNVVDAYLDVYSAEVPPGTLLNLLKAISETRTLDLRSDTTKWLLRAPVLNFPEFCNLVCLNIVLPFFNSNFVMNLLSKCPRVQILKIKTEKEPPTVLRSWATPTNVPRCLLSTTRDIYIKGFQGFADEVAFVKFLLRNGLVLETLAVICDNFLAMRIKDQIIGELRVERWGSNMCEFYMV